MEEVTVQGSESAGGIVYGIYTLGCRHPVRYCHLTSRHAVGHVEPGSFTPKSGQTGWGTITQRHPYPSQPGAKKVGPVERRVASTLTNETGYSLVGGPGREEP